MLGVICGLEMEAKIARRFAGDMVAVSAARTHIARNKAVDLINRGATRLMSFGLAGGLASNLRAGDVIIGSHVLVNAKTFKCDIEWIETLLKKLGRVRCGSVWGAEGIVSSAADKKLLNNTFGCLITDMESHCVAEIAASRNLPFSVVRVVVDDANFDIPPASLLPIREDGMTDLRGVIRSIANDPLQIPQLIGLAIRTGKAISSMKKISKRLSDKSA